MFGWIFSLVLFIAYAVTKVDALIIASGIFAVAGSIAMLELKLKLTK